MAIAKEGPAATAVIQVSERTGLAVLPTNNFQRLNAQRDFQEHGHGLKPQIVVANTIPTLGRH